MIRINLTGDYQIDKPASTSELLQLDAFLGALRGSALSDTDAFLKGLSTLVAGVKRKNMTNVALQIVSELDGNKLTHEFRIVEI